MIPMWTAQANVELLTMIGDSVSLKFGEECLHAEGGQPVHRQGVVDYKKKGFK